MALSSNWSKLIQAKKVTVTAKNAVRKSSRINSKRPIHKSKTSKLMNMVYDMNKEIIKAEQDKKNGKGFEFKSETNSSKILTDKLEQSDTSSVLTKRKYNIGKYVAMDCEFVGIGLEGKESALARVSIVNYYGHIILDTFVKPQEKVTDWRTMVSGVRPSDMNTASTFQEAQQKTSAVLEGRILVGHAIKHDLEALLISHPVSMIRDTSKHVPFRTTYSKGKAPSLKKLSKEILKVDIQEREHSSVEDARATMLIYKTHKKEFEQLHLKRIGGK
ncbi:hypothetical protein TBLA_0F01090 [Henningerozyma blattae CBS 6284]|uniref:RNA exonuclease 4 n=1 Tax=Henningerozyma blattae (strain ATCC 34711 / CBS 6284 / DSM 70876 / NBRC 10599 / NRRL Y-10934 / UCD 77-7) TaxID=1071380 RepID=I2H5K0_HENB6|nr:hypothetical protein TBLA_0F01090 [Tetrapisispora blattae CBS 6284]CCH61652.1 hypothetical protein TBLA_0F01090 [Tetrapisispora blattae CBS 6284]